MKEKLSALFGSFGVVIWFLISAIYCYSPLLIFKFPIYVELILFLAMFSIPIIGEVIRLALYIWAFTIAISMPIDALTVVFFICAGLYFFTELFPTIVGFFRSKNKDKDDEEQEKDIVSRTTRDPMLEKTDVLEDEIAELDAIYSNIMEKGYKNPEIISMASEAGMESKQYKEFIKQKMVEKQRYYNTIIQQEGISRRPYVIDTFDENQLNYKLLDSVEIDIEKRLKASTKYTVTKEIGRNDSYIFYIHRGTLLRETKDSHQFSYFGDVGNISALFGNWIYWAGRGSGENSGNGYIFRRSIDGTKTEMYDWISNQKILVAPNGFARWKSEDVVVSMEVEGNALIIRVMRHLQEDVFYKIIVKERSGQLSVHSIDESGKLRGLKECSVNPVLDE